MLDDVKILLINLKLETFSALPKSRRKMNANELCIGQRDTRMEPYPIHRNQEREVNLAKYYPFMYEVEEDSDGYACMEEEDADELEDQDKEEMFREMMIAFREMAQTQRAMIKSIKNRLPNLESARNSLGNIGLNDYANSSTHQSPFKKRIEDDIGQEPEVSMADLARLRQKPDEKVSDFISRFKRARTKCKLQLPEAEFYEVSTGWSGKRTSKEV
ncbi:hypothetical protein RHMOL_Rhmol11G0001200 [Rhododendron molle]|uniref:Uncharacterized protein n=1 Tax=Rhododendron molle TaxID=49168 RepID=A0ACC0LNQ3_RHOML|nr:hypothetical protein RHMOL_Rhmol11G0001200 [Rhododendron molle]